MTQFEEKLGAWVVRRRWEIIVFAIMVILIAASGVRFLTFSNDLRVFFSKKNPQLQALETLENTYNKIDTVFFAIAPEDGNVFTRTTLAAVYEITEASWQMPYSSRIDSLANFQHTRVDGDDLIVEDLVQVPSDLTQTELERIKRIALSEPLLVNRLISASGHVTGINVDIILPGKSLEEVPEVTRFARKLSGEIKQKYPGIRLYLAGGVIADNAFSEAGINDISFLVPAMFITLFIIIGLTLQTPSGTVATVVITSVSMATGMGLAGWMGISLTTASTNAPIIILTLAVADSIHLLATMFQQMRAGYDKHQAITESIRINLQPVFLTSITTIIGFLTMNFSEVPPFRDLGNIVAMGVASAFIYSILLLPALMAVLPLRVKHNPIKTDHTCCGWLADLAIKQHKPVFLASLVTIAVLTAGIFKIELNDNWYNYFDKSFDIRNATDFIQENLTGTDFIEYSLESGETGGINNPEYLSTVEQFSNWYRRQPKVAHVNTITDTMKRLNKNMHEDNESYYTIPDRRNLAAQYLLLYEMSLPFGHDLNDRINVDKSATRMTVTLNNTTTRELREMDVKARNWLKANAPESMFTYGTGISIIWAHISGRNIKSMLGASLWALLLISGLLIFALRSIRLGLLSMIPNLAPAFMAFGIWGITMGQVGLGLSVIASMTIGIVVDDTVHFLSKYIRARREHGLNPPDAVRYTFNTVGTAMWVTTLSLVSGFSILSFSGFKMNSEMALMTALTMVLALALDFLFLPALLLVATVRQKPRDRHD